MPGPLDGLRQPALVLGTGARPPAGQNAPPLVDVPGQRGDILIVDGVDLLGTEGAHLPAPTASPAPRAEPAATPCATTAIAIATPANLDSLDLPAFLRALVRSRWPPAIMGDSVLPRCRTRTIPRPCDRQMPQDVVRKPQIAFDCGDRRSFQVGLHEHIVALAVPADGVCQSALAHVLGLENFATIGGHDFFDPLDEPREALLVQVRLRDKDQLISTQWNCPLPLDK